jgi:hypothetical protein
VPPAVFLLAGLLSEMSPASVFSAMVAQYGDARPNLLVTGIIGLIPLAALGIVLWVHRVRGGSPRTRKYLLLGGLVPVLAVLVWSNYEFWSVFLPGRRAPGFPHGLELFIGPVIFAPVAMVVGMLVSWLAGRSRS